MTRRDATASQARTLVDEWARAGVQEAVLAPGSRSAPLALALAADDRIRLTVVLDERSASFFALGTAKASGRPAVLLCTSGTAAANFHPAVLEAWHSRMPLIVCTADRSPELRDTGAGQAVDQMKLYGGAVRWFAEVGVPEDVEGAGRYWRSVAARSCAEALGPPSGPVHLNLAYREPLIPTGEPLMEADGRPGARPWTSTSSRPRPPHPDDVTEVTALVDDARRGVLVGGWGAGLTAESVHRFAWAAGWPVLADAVSGMRSGPTAVSTYDPLLRSAEFAASMVPDLVVHVGAPLTNKAATRWLDGVPRLIVDPDGSWLDPNRSAGRRVAADPDLLLRAVSDDICWRGPRAPWLERWREAEAVARRTIDGLLDSWEEPFEGRVVRDVARALPGGTALVVGSSMPVRDAESFVAPREGLRWLCNRGVNGIDGFVSTVLGVGLVHGDGPVVALLGDLTLLHDVGGLLWSADRGVYATLVVLDNEGGGIFSFLPQAGLPEHFETLFGTPHGLDLDDVAAAYGVPAVRVTDAAGVVPAVREAMGAGGVRMVIVPTDRAANVARHREVWAAVESAIG